MLDPGSTGGAVGNDGALHNNLTDPCWLLDRAARLLHHDPRPMRTALAPLGRTMAGALSALRYQAGTCGEPLGEVVSQAITHLRLWAGAVAAEREQPPSRQPQGAALRLPPPPGRLARRGGQGADGEVEGAQDGEPAGRKQRPRDALGLPLPPARPSELGGRPVPSAWP